MPWLSPESQRRRLTVLLGSWAGPCVWAGLGWAGEPHWRNQVVHRTGGDGHPFWTIKASLPGSVPLKEGLQRDPIPGSQRFAATEIDFLLALRVRCGLARAGPDAKWECVLGNEKLPSFVMVPLSEMTSSVFTEFPVRQVVRAGSRQSLGHSCALSLGQNSEQREGEPRAGVREFKKDVVFVENDKCLTYCLFTFQTP